MALLAYLGSKTCKDGCLRLTLRFLMLDHNKAFWRPHKYNIPPSTMNTRPFHPCSNQPTTHYPHRPATYFIRIKHENHGMGSEDHSHEILLVREDAAEDMGVEKRCSPILCSAVRQVVLNGERPAAPWSSCTTASEGAGTDPARR